MANDYGFITTYTQSHQIDNRFKILTSNNLQCIVIWKKKYCKTRQEW